MPRPGQTIALCVLALLMLGVVMVNSANMSVQRVAAEAPSAEGVTARSILLSRSTIYMVLALAAMGLAALLPVRALAEGWAQRLDSRSPMASLRLLALGAALLVCVCALVYMPGLSKEINGSHRWLRIPVPGLADAMSMQPSEIAKWGMLPLIALYAVLAGPRLRSFWVGLVPALAAAGCVAAFIVLEDLGTGALIGLVACIVLLAAGARFWHFLLFVPLGAAAVAAAIITSPYRVNRILAFIDPYADSQGIGYHTIQSLVAVASGEGWGRGLGGSLQKFGYLPEGPTDFLFAIICEELGIPGAALVMFLLGGIFWAGHAVMMRERSPLLRLWILGIISTVAIQALINIAVVTGLAPTKGIALPLLSSGGTGWILTAFCLGIVISIDRSAREDDGDAELAPDLHSLADARESRPMAEPKPETRAAARAPEASSLAA